MQTKKKNSNHPVAVLKQLPKSIADHTSIHNLINMFLLSQFLNIRKLSKKQFPRKSFLYYVTKY